MTSHEDPPQYLIPYLLQLEELEKPKKSSKAKEPQIPTPEDMDIIIEQGGVA